MATDPDISDQLGNLTHNVKYLVGHSPYPSVWSLIRDHYDQMVNQAFQRAVDRVKSGFGIPDSQSFKQYLKSFLERPLDEVPAGHPAGQGNHTIHGEVQGAIEAAVNETMQELNISDVASNTSSFKESFVTTLDSEIEMDVFNKVFRNATHMMDDSNQDTDFFHKLPIKDETMFVVLVCMGVIVPIIFITLLLIFFYKRRKDNKERREEMLLREQPEFALDDYNTEGKPREEEGVPDLVKNLRI